MSAQEDRLEVRYTAKELFARIDAKLDHLLEVIPTKADAAELQALEARVEALETREAERRGFGSAQKAIIALLVTIAGLLVPIVLHYLP